MTDQQIAATLNLYTDVLHARKTQHPALETFWSSVLHTLRDLARGNHVPDNLLAFTIHQSCGGLPGQHAFLDAFAQDIAAAGGMIMAIVDDIKSTLPDEER